MTLTDKERAALVADTAPPPPKHTNPPRLRFPKRLLGKLLGWVAVVLFVVFVSPVLALLMITYAALTGKRGAVR